MQDVAFTQRQLGIDEKRMERQLRRTSFDFDFNIRQIVRRLDNRVQIDLQPFYRIMDDKTEADIDSALLEFFARGIVGLLTKRNRHLIMENPNRHKVFMNVIKSLHDLLFLTRKFDKQSSLRAKAEADLNRLIDALNSQSSAVHVRGAVLPDLDLDFALPDMAWLKDGDLSIERQTARLTVRGGATDNHREVTQVDIGGEAAVLHPNPEELQGISIRIHEGRPVWEPGGAIAEGESHT